jgi:hypothetical protein
VSVRNKTAGGIADLIERFLSNRLRYPQEWNDFTDCSNRNPNLDFFRKQCEIISSALESDRKSLDLNRNERWRDAIEDLKGIADQLRDLEKNVGN